jgi:hypothetical protein
MNIKLENIYNLTTCKIKSLRYLVVSKPHNICVISQSNYSITNFKILKMTI